MKDRFPQCAHDSWRTCPAFSNDILEALAFKLTKGTFYPEPLKIFEAFSLPLDEVKVIIVGMSPYHNTYKGLPNATGRAFAIDPRPYDTWPPSLQLIADVFANEQQIEDVVPYFDCTMDHWANQGILLINASLTTIINEAGSHLEVWQPFMNAFFEFMGEARPGLIYYFMGADAKKYRKKLFELGNIVVESFHPAYWARMNKDFEDHKFGEVRTAYRHMYGEELNYLIPF